MNTTIILLVIVLSAFYIMGSKGFYIKNADEKSIRAAAKNNGIDDWGVFQSTLGLSQQKVELLKSQKDQHGTKQLLSRFIKENPKYLAAVPTPKKRQGDQFEKLYLSLIKKLKMSKQMLKTSLNFELADRPKKSLRRPRRKINVKMVSDMSTEQVDDLLKMFYQKHGIESNPTNYDSSDDDNEDYSDTDSEMPQLTPMNSNPETTDYAYDNLYDDEVDVGLSEKSRQNSEYGSFQDLIMQATRNQWERESEETKLHSPAEDHFFKA